MPNLLKWIGGLGAGLGIACCVTPLLPALLGALGLAGLTGLLYRDAVLLSFAAFCAALFIVGMLIQRRRG